MRKLELLAPAKNLACGIAAVDHGADAVYIGAPRFGARAAVGNSVEDIRKLCEYAHPFGVRVYVTVNTILYDDELEATRQLLLDLEAAGVDTVKELKHRVPANLQAKLEEINAQKNLVNRVPALKEVEKMIAQAKELKPLITY